MSFWTGLGNVASWPASQVFNGGKPYFQDPHDNPPQPQAPVQTNSSFTQGGTGTVYQGGQPMMTGPGYEGMPNTPYYNSIYNPATQNLTPQLQGKLNDIDTSGVHDSVNNFADLANRKGPSAWAQLASQQQNSLAENQLERGGAQSNAATAGALGQLGQSGGITSGARERAAEGGAKNVMDMSQNVARQNSLNQMQIGVNDEQNKMQEMGMLPGMEVQALQPEFQKTSMWDQQANQDTKNTMAESEAENAFNQNLYGLQTQAWGANQQANSIAKQGKKG